MLKPHIQKITRVQTSENRDLVNGTLLDRNERVESFNDKTYRSIIKNISRFSLNATPDIQNLYKKISKLFKIKIHNIYIGQGITELMSHIIFSLVKKNEEVFVPSLTFVASVHPIIYIGAIPHFVDANLNNFGVCEEKFETYLKKISIKRGNNYYNKKTKRKLSAIIVVHVFGNPCNIDKLKKLAKKYKLKLIEDSTEALGSFYKKTHVGNFGETGVFSFNGNKIITTGGGGAVLCSSLDIGERVKHVTTTAKVAHPYEFIHDEAGFNYRMPNLNAALGCAQIEMLDGYLMKKRKLAMHYKDYFNKTEYTFFDEPTDTKSNFWLNTLICADLEARDSFLKQTNNSGVMTRPVWQLMNKLPMYINAPRGTLVNSEWFESRAVNIPSSPVRN